jgi:hypothetical protein
MFALVLCGLCAAARAGGGILLLGLFDVPLSFWHPAIGAAIGGGVGGALFGHIVSSYLRPFYAAYIKAELRRLDT